ncbi:hypothetical protein Anas_13964, partial [Armadillidium nasatum]
MLGFFYTLFFALLTLVQKTLYDFEPSFHGNQGSQISSQLSSSEYQADDHSVHISSPLLEFAELLSKPPENEVQADWSVVSGTFTHYDNKNWKNFLRQLDSIDQKEPQESSKDFEVLIHAVTWYLEHDTKFRLGETFTEIDPDKTESK